MKGVVSSMEEEDGLKPEPTRALQPARDNVIALVLCSSVSSEEEYVIECNNKVRVEGL